MRWYVAVCVCVCVCVWVCARLEIGVRCDVLGMHAGLPVLAKELAVLCGLAVRYVVVHFVQYAVRERWNVYDGCDESVRVHYVGV